MKGQGLKTMNNRVKLVATQYAAGMFAIFCKETARGENFRWETFPAVVSKLIDSNMFIYFPDGKMPKYDSDVLKTYVDNLVSGWIYDAGFKDDE